MNPLAICLASAVAVWIATLVMSETSVFGRVNDGAERSGQAAARFYLLRFVIVPMTTLWPLLLLLAISGRAIFSTLIILAALVCLAIANHTKIATLHEPAVFSDFGHLFQLLTNPGFYFPFAGIWLSAGVIVTAVSLAMAALLLETSLWPENQAVLLRVGLVAGSALAIFGWRSFVRGCFRLSRLDRSDLSDEPARGLARFGLIGMWLLQYASAADREELERIRGYRPMPKPSPGPDQSRPHLIAVQAESFFDVRRLFARIGEAPPVRLTNFERACDSGILSGPLEVSAWGANSLRTEFGVLSGIPQAELGVHRFNPFQSVARRPVWTVAHYLRSLGYRTIFVHPFSRRFFGRDRVYGNLGFDEFLDIDAFAGAPRCGPYVCDRAIAALIGEILAEQTDGRPSFIFAVTMEAHGPWLPGASAERLLPHLPTLPPAIASYELARLLYHLQHTDQMIGDIMALAGGSRRQMVLGLYGDHLPILSETFGRVGFHETATDYAIWRSGQASGRRGRMALAPDTLGLEFLAAAGLGDGLGELAILGQGPRSRAEG